jgi:hypothetical protein
MAKTYILVIKDRSSIPILLTQFKDQASGARSGPGRFKDPHQLADRAGPADHTRAQDKRREDGQQKAPRHTGPPGSPRMNQ